MRTFHSIKDVRTIQTTLDGYKDRTLRATCVCSVLSTLYESLNYAHNKHYKICERCWIAYTHLLIQQLTNIAIYFIVCVRPDVGTRVSECRWHLKLVKHSYNKYSIIYKMVHTGRMVRCKLFRNWRHCLNLDLTQRIGRMTWKRTHHTTRYVTCLFNVMYLVVYLLVCA